MFLFSCRCSLGVLIDGVLFICCGIGATGQGKLLYHVSFSVIDTLWLLL